MPASCTKPSWSSLWKHPETHGLCLAMPCGNDRGCREHRIEHCSCMNIGSVIFKGFFNHLFEARSVTWCLPEYLQELSRTITLYLQKRKIATKSVILIFWESHSQIHSLICLEAATSLRCWWLWLLNFIVKGCFLFNVINRISVNLMEIVCGSWGKRCLLTRLKERIHFLPLKVLILV